MEHKKFIHMSSVNTDDFRFWSNMWLIEAKELWNICYTYITSFTCTYVYIYQYTHTDITKVLICLAQIWHRNFKKSKYIFSIIMVPLLISHIYTKYLDIIL